MIIGSKIPRVDGLEKVTGEAKFTADLRFPGMLEAKVLRSPLPHAAIESIDARKAEALPGVVAVLTRDDLGDINPFYGNCFRDRPIVAIDRVRFVGEPVAVIAADDGMIAEEALALMDVRYRELPVLSTVEDALAPEAILLHENLSGAGEFHDIASLGGKPEPNICHYEHYEKGDVARGFSEADEVIEESYEFPMVYQYAMEPHTSVARVTSEGITLWTSSAHPFLVRAELAHMFGLPHSRVEVIVPFVGGAYGSKNLFQDRAAHCRHGAQDRRKAGQARAKRSRIDANHAPTFGALPYAHRREARWHTRRPRSGSCDGHRRLCRQRPAGGSARG